MQYSINSQSLTLPTAFGTTIANVYIIIYIAVNIIFQAPAYQHVSDPAQGPLQEEIVC